jgi:hypothetical protein
MFGLHLEDNQPTPKTVDGRILVLTGILIPGCLWNWIKERYAESNLSLSRTLRIKMIFTKEATICPITLS